MSRSQRLLFLLQVLRRHRFPVSGATLAAETGVSLRTLYRDIATLQSEGADIEGEPGIGYVLRPGYMLPPLMFTREEIEALMLGFRFVEKRTDEAIAAAAHNALAKIDAVLPEDLRRDMAEVPLLVGPGAPLANERIDLQMLRQALRNERPLLLAYRDQHGKVSSRAVWPCALTFFDGVRVLVAWCTLREDFRHFRTDRIESATAGETRYPKRRSALLKAWRQKNSIPDNIG
ncbi:helix-turn-helix transcriptional regulator [Rhizobium glycinendophyticum]|uniref:YafY family transcriptional regulator n=1 Tax=Rhizobium glycinendophyticum TaxID=2589807 RepID=A0A504UM63_9HYPH|nr:YafY family protein [Rhizobium glycinendophyticum]TPP06542.1 YafY family transcriptional regulator [Rhizobium glycinendophyticum]